MYRKSRALGAAIAATLGAQAADAATFTLTLQSIASYSGNGSSAGEIGTSTATWQYDDVTNLLSQTGGTFNVRFSIAPNVTTLFRHQITGLVIGNGGAALAAIYECNEGNFGRAVGASLCGNYNFGANFTNNSSSTWGPGTDFARTIGGDDMTLPIGAQHSILTYDSFATIAWTGTSLTLSNAGCNPAAPGNASGCATLPSNSNTGYTWILRPLHPAVEDDSASTTRNSSISIDVLGNDTDVTGAAPTIMTPPTLGSAVVNGNAIDYTPNLPAGQATTNDTFTYTVTGAAGPATVTVTINNTVPSAQGVPAVAVSTQGVAPDAASGTFTAPGTGGSLGDSGTVSITTQGTQGTATVSGTTITYTPGANFFEGADSFTYQIVDTDGETSTASVDVTIANLTPALAGGSGQTSIYGATTFDLADGLTAGNGSLAQHSFAVVVDASNGSCAISGTTLTYTPNTVLSGSDSCQMEVTDGDGSTSSAAIYHVELEKAARDDAATTAVDQPVAIPVLANDIGFFADSVIVASYSTPLHGTLTIEGSPGPKSGITVIYSPATGFKGTDQFQYVVDDGIRVGIATVTVKVILDPDGDDIDQAVDNCTMVKNPDQRDTNGDGYGNFCDADLDNNGFVNYADLAILRQVFGTNNPDVDFNGNGIVNFGDLAIFRALFGKPPGPSGTVQ